MKVTHQLSRLESLILDPLHGLDGEDWHLAPAHKWGVAQIVEHCAIGVDNVGATLERRADKAAMKRRSKPYQTMLRHLVLGIGRLPSGLPAVRGTEPSERPDPELVKARFRMGVERLRRLSEDWPEEQQVNRFVVHPLLGDLNLPEWVRFHYLHCRHHARQIDDRIAWLRDRST